MEPIGLSAKQSYLIARALVVIGMIISEGGCGKETPNMQSLKAQNAQLQAEVQELKRRLGEPQTPAEEIPIRETVDLRLTVTELWNQRFEDNKFRAKKRLDQKNVQLSGDIDTTNSRTISLRAANVSSRFGAASISVQLDEGYAIKVQKGILALEPGIPITVKGRFIFDKMWIINAEIVDPKSGRALTSEQLIELAKKDNLESD